MSVTDETLREWVGREAGTIDLSDVEANEIFAELLALREEVDFERKRVWALIEEKDVVPGDDFRKQMAFDRERYEGACKRADQLREIGNNHAVNTQRERRRAEAAEVEVERLKKNAVRNWPLEMAMVEGDRDHWKARALKAEAKS